MRFSKTTKCVLAIAGGTFLAGMVNVAPGQSGPVITDPERVGKGAASGWDAAAVRAQGGDAERGAVWEAYSAVAPPATFAGPGFYQEGYERDPEVTTKKSPWIYTWFTHRFRFEVSYSITAGYHIQFPAVVEFEWDPEQVFPGNTFEVYVTMATYNSDVPYEYRATLPGVDPGIREQVLICTWWTGCRWVTILNWTADYLFASFHNFDDDHPPDLGDHRNSFDEDIAVPLPKGLLDLVLSIKLRLKHEMQDRNIQGSASVADAAPTDATTDTTASYVWDENYETQAIAITLPDDFCDDPVTLTLETDFEYWNRGYFVPALIFFPGTPIEFEFEGWIELQLALWLIDQVNDEFGFFSNQQVEKWISALSPPVPPYYAASHPFVVPIPVKHKPDLCAEGLQVYYKEAPVVLDCLDGLQPFYPVLRAEIHNCGCPTIDQQFHVKFTAKLTKANSHVYIDEVLYGDDLDETPLERDETVYVNSRPVPISLIAGEYQVTVDSRQQIDEKSETNNTAEVVVSQPMEYPVVNPIPGPIMAGNCDPSSHTIGPIPIGDADLVTPGIQLTVDFSYIYDYLLLKVAFPIGEPVHQTNPGPQTVTVTTQFEYDLYKADGITWLSTETVQLAVPGVPGTPQVSLPSLVGELNLAVEGNVPGADLVDTEILCNVLSRDGSVECKYGPYTMKYGSGTLTNQFSFPHVSLLPGDNTIEVIALNEAGGWATSGLLPVEMDLLWDPTDGTGPKISIMSPKYNEDPALPCKVYITDPTPEVVAQINDVDVVHGKLGTGVDPARITVTVDAGTLDKRVYDSSTGVEFTEPGTLRFVVPTKLSEGEHSITIEADDRMANPGTDITHFCVDTVPPAIEVVAIPVLFEPCHDDIGTTCTTLTYTIREDAIVTLSLYAGAVLPGQADDSDYRTTVYRDAVVPGTAPPDPPPGKQQYSAAGSHKVWYDGSAPRAGCATWNETGDRPVCTSTQVAYYDLDDGLYTIVADAVDRAGNVGQGTGVLKVKNANSISDEYSDFIITPSTSACMPSKATLTLNDGLDQPVTGRLVAILPVSDRNTPPADIQDVFFTGAMPQGGVIVVPTDDIGQITFPVQGLSLSTEPATISCYYLVYDPEGNVSPTLIGEASLDTTSVCADSVDADNSSVAIVGVPQVGGVFYLEVTLKNNSGELLEDITVGLKAKSDRNLGGTPVDYFFDPAGPQDTFVPVHTGSEIGSEGKVLIPVLATTPTGMSPQATFSVHLSYSGGEVQLGKDQTDVVDFKEHTGACCGPKGCAQLTEEACEAFGKYRGDETTCQEECADPIPTVSDWGLLVMAVLVIAAGAVVVKKRLARAA